MFSRVRGLIRFYSERFGGRPFVDCLICAIMTLLRFMGMSVKDGDQKVIRDAMPGDPQAGTSVAMNFAALRALGCPTMPSYGAFDPAGILAGLKVGGQSKNGKTGFVVSLRTSVMPADSPTRRLTGLSYKGLHAVALMAKSEDESLIYVVNPMGRDAAHPPKPTPPDWEPYRGTWEPAANLWLAATKTATGRIKAVFGTHNQAHGGTP